MPAEQRCSFGRPAARLRFDDVFERCNRNVDVRKVERDRVRSKLVVAACQSGRGDAQIERTLVGDPGHRGRLGEQVSVGLQTDALDAQQSAGGSASDDDRPGPADGDPRRAPGPAGLTAADAGGWVFVGHDGRPLDYSNWRQRVWLPARRRAGLPGLAFHDLRHAAATALVAENVDLKTTQHRLGHSDPRTTLALYAQATTEGDRAAAELLGARLMGHPAPVARDGRAGFSGGKEATRP